MGDQEKLLDIIAPKIFLHVMVIMVMATIFKTTRDNCFEMKSPTQSRKVSIDKAGLITSKNLKFLFLTVKYLKMYNRPFENSC